MTEHARTPRRSTTFGAAVLIGAVVGFTGCSGGSAPQPGAPAPVNKATPAEWRALATPRPAALEGAARVAVGDVEVLADDPWGTRRLVPPGLALEELVAAGLLRRRDVRYVERRRFAAAAEDERRGRARAEGAPAAGVSEGPEYLLSATWAPLGMGDAYLDVRLADAQSGAIVATARTSTPDGADAASVARSVVTGLLQALDEAGRRPAWSDPVSASAPDPYRPSGVGAAAVEAFLSGLAAEERWDWEAARRGYQAAVERGGAAFFEASAALSRAARLHNGGTLGEG